jgi:formylmethanofuran dehydrogenase subunit A
LAELVNANKNITCDVGAVTFGPAAAGHGGCELCKKLGRGKRGFQSQWWEQGRRVRVMPLKYEAETKSRAQTQFLTGLELMLLVEEASRILPHDDHTQRAGRLPYYRI